MARKRQAANRSEPQRRKRAREARAPQPPPSPESPDPDPQDEQLTSSPSSPPVTFPTSAPTQPPPPTQQPQQSQSPPPRASKRVPHLPDDEQTQPTTEAEQQQEQQEQKKRSQLQQQQKQQRQQQQQQEQPSQPPSSEETVVIFQCGSCRAIVGDTTTSYSADLDNGIILLSAACGLSVSSELHFSKVGFDAGCAYKPVACAQCDASLGRLYTSTPTALDSYRASYTLHTEALSSYELGSVTTLTGAAPTPSASGEALRAHAADHQQLQTSSAASVAADVLWLKEHVVSLSDAFDKLSADIDVKIEQRDTDWAQTQESLRNVHSMFLVWEERFRVLDRCDKSVSKLMTERQIRNRRLLPPSNPSASPPPQQQLKQQQHKQQIQQQRQQQQQQQQNSQTPRARSVHAPDVQVVEPAQTTPARSLRSIGHGVPTPSRLTSQRRRA